MKGERELQDATSNDAFTETPVQMASTEATIKKWPST